MKNCRNLSEDENKEQQVRESARERKAEKQEQIGALENEREELEEKERVKNIFKKYGVTVTAVGLAVEMTIGVIVNSLTKGLKSVATGV